MSAPRLAIFDCDGTMVDSQAHICRAMEEAFALEGLAAPDHHHVRRVVGLSLAEAMRALLPDFAQDGHERLVVHYRTAFADLRVAGLVQEPLYDGFAALVTRLAEEGWLLGIATGKSDRGLAHCLERHGLAARFVTLQTADRHPSKPHPAMVEAAIADAGVERGRAVMIGDTSFDMAMAVNAGIPAVGVDWGYHAPEDLLDAGAIAVATSMDELHMLIGQAVP